MCPWLQGLCWVAVMAGTAAAAPATWQQVLEQPRESPSRVHAYGAHPDQFAELWLPDGAGPHPVVVLVHGGCWLDAFGVDHTRPLAAAIRRLGHAVWAIEYRRAGGAGGWPETFVDAGQALDALAGIDEVDQLALDRLTLLGHSAGGQLALWLASRPGLDPERPWSGHGRLTVRRVIAMAPITDLIDYGRAPGSCPDGARLLLGGVPEDWPERYAAVDPMRRALPARLEVDLVHAQADPIVPFAHSERYLNARAAAGGQVRLHRLPEGAGHFDVLLSAGPAWDLLRSLLTEEKGR